MVLAGPKFCGTSQFAEVSNELTLMVPPLVQKDFLWQPVMDDEIVPLGHGHCWGHLTLSDICLGVPGEVVHHYQYVLFLSLPCLQAQVTDVH